ncbi:MAG TPA: methionyl-tRNA formyltransferase [Desulfurobacteriaceae bacterium]|nr:methionyl-tRNA formyltransferase [Desulfurobacteriaceae bacterium]
MEEISLKIKTIFFGSDNFSLDILKRISNEIDYIEIIGIITTPDKPKGRGYKLSPTVVKKFAIEKKIKCISPSSLKKEKDEILNFIKDAQMGLLVSYGKIIPEYLLESFKLGIFNIHPSLLPKYRGASPIETCLLNGDSITGVSLILLTPGLDEGPVFAQEKLVIKKEDDVSILRKKLVDLAIKILKQSKDKFFSFKNYLEENNLTAYKFYKFYKDFLKYFTPQKDLPYEISYTSKLSNNLRIISFRKETAQEILNKIKALKERKPPYFLLKGKQVQILKARIYKENSNFKPGQIAKVTKNSFLIQTKDGLLEPLVLKKEGKKEVDVKSFLAGIKLKEGEFLE